MANMIKRVFSNLFGRPATRLYPVTRREPFVGSRGRLQNDIDKCIFCGQCQRRCPADAIVVGKKPDKSWAFDRYRCIVCGYCVEVCPVHCLSMDPKHGD
jgi:formate hydrogenlyase subunit 6/NADH:ubiquinone oxidoreductase subunit I